MFDLTDAGALTGVLGAGTVVTALAISTGLIVVLLPLLRRYALARPNARSSHRKPTPQGAGIAVLAATLGATAVVVLIARISSLDALATLAPLFAAAILLGLVGAIDDLRTLPASPRLAVQAVAVFIVVATLPDDLRIVPLLPHWLEQALLVIGGVYFVNLVNFMDGIDWMTVAEVVPLTAGLAVIGALGVLPDYAIVVVLALNGAMLGFAPFNQPVAKVFLGDVGSLPIGLLLGWMLVLVAGAGHIAAAILLPLYYLSDASITLLRRCIAAEPIWQAHRTHFYQRAGDAGYSNIGIVARVFAVNVGLAVLATVTVVMPSWPSRVACLALGSAMVAWLIVSFGREKS